MSSKKIFLINFSILSGAVIILLFFTSLKTDFLHQVVFAEIEQVSHSGINITADIIKKEVHPNCVDGSGNILEGKFCSGPFCCPAEMINGVEGACVFKCSAQGTCDTTGNNLWVAAKNSNCGTCKEIKVGVFSNPPPWQEYITFTDEKTGNKYTLVGQNTCKANGMSFYQDVCGPAPVCQLPLNPPDPEKPVRCPSGEYVSHCIQCPEMQQFNACITLGRKSGLLFSQYGCNELLGGRCLNSNCGCPENCTRARCCCALEDLGCFRYTPAGDCFCSVYFEGGGANCTEDPDCANSPETDALRDWWTLGCPDMVPPSSECEDLRETASRCFLLPASQTCGEQGGVVCTLPSRCASAYIPAIDTDRCCLECYDPSGPGALEVDLKLATNSSDWQDSLSSETPLAKIVDLRASVSGSAQGTINYKFDCTNDGTWDYTYDNISDNPKIVDNACSYPSYGLYTVKVFVERSTYSAEDTATVWIGFVSLNVNLQGAVNESDWQESLTGFIPFNDVDLKATVSGTASGTVNYEFDCTNDTILEAKYDGIDLSVSDPDWVERTDKNNKKYFTKITSPNVFAIKDICDYVAVGNYTAKVKTQRDTAIAAEDTVIIAVSINNTPFTSNLQAEVTQGCFVLSSVRLGWTFSDPDTEDYQEAYQIQIDDNSDFTSPVADSGKVSSSSNSYSPAAGLLANDKDYYWRVKVWDNRGGQSGESDWNTGPSFRFNSYPSPNFKWLPLIPKKNQAVSFTNLTSCSSPPCLYNWTFANATPSSSTEENPAGVVFKTKGEKLVTLSATDAEGETCQISKDISVGGVIPKWREFLPF